MPRSEDEAGVTISVLDRLLDYDPGAAREANLSRPKRVRQLKDAVRRDLEWLLNTRQGELVPDLKETNSSLAAFGLPDFANLSAHKPDDQKEIRRQIEDAIRFFEPRLDFVVVTFQPAHSTDRLMHFRINAHLKVDPEPEPITFDTVVQMGNGQYVVREE
jgi:type VI secretion system protein ImpF